MNLFKPLTGSVGRPGLGLNVISLDLNCADINQDFFIGIRNSLIGTIVILFGIVPHALNTAKQKNRTSEYRIRGSGTEVELGRHTCAGGERKKNIVHETANFTDGDTIFPHCSGFARHPKK